MLAILPATKFVVNFSLIEWLEALGTDKATLVQNLSIRVDYLLFLFEAFVTMRTK